MATSGGDATRPVPKPDTGTVGGAPSRSVTARPSAAGGGAGTAGGGSGPSGGDGRSRRTLVLGGLGIVAVGIGAGVGLALVTDSGGESKTAASSTTVSSTTSTAPTTTSTASTTTTSTASTTTTTAPTTTTTTSAAPVIASFTAPATADCATDDPITLSWSTQNAIGVTISIDGPGVFDRYPASGSAQVPFSCGPASHSYLLRTSGGGPPASQTRVVQQSP